MLINVRLDVNEAVFLGELMYDLLEPARDLSFKAQKEQVNFINLADIIGQRKRRFERLRNKTNAQPNLIFEFPMVNNILSIVKSTNFFGTDEDGVTIYK